MTGNAPDSLGELARLIRQLEQHMDRRFNAIEQRQDKLVSAELHSVYVQHTDQRLNELAKMLAAERQARVEDIAEEAKERETAANRNASRMDRMETRQTALLIGVLVPIGLFIMTIILSVGR